MFTNVQALTQFGFGSRKDWRSYLFETATWGVLLTVETHGGPHAHLGFTPWPLEPGGAPCFYHAGQESA